MSCRHGRPECLQEKMYTLPTATWRGKGQSPPWDFAPPQVCSMEGGGAKICPRVQFAQKFLNFAPPPPLSHGSFNSPPCYASFYASPYTIYTQISSFNCIRPIGTFFFIQTGWTRFSFLGLCIAEKKNFLWKRHGRQNSFFVVKELRKFYDKGV